MRKKLVNAFDWMIYRLSFRSMRRMFKTDPGMAYLLKLELDRLSDESNMPDTLKESAESFHSSLTNMVKHGV